MALMETTKFGEPRTWADVYTGKVAKTGFDAPAEVPMGTDTLTAWTIKQFVRHRERMGGSSATSRAYANDLTLLLNGQSGIYIDELEDEAVEWLNAHRDEWSAATMQRRRAAVRSWAAWALGTTPKQVAILATYKAPTPPKGVPHPVPDLMAGVQAMYDACETIQERALIALCGFMGLRASEALAVTADDVREDDVLVRGKGAKERYVPMPTHAQQAIITARFIAGNDGHNDPLVPV